MTRVRLVYGWQGLDPRRQTPGQRGVWQDVEFLCDGEVECDYAVVLARVPEPTLARCPLENVWFVMQEPPDELHRDQHRGPLCARRVFIQEASLTGPRYVQSQPALQWHVGRQYDQLIGMGPPQKTRRLSWVTSAKAITRGHRARMAFLRRIEGRMDFDLYGRGFTPIDDKWDGLAPYRYAFAIENHRGPHYWSEKLADCFLAWAMPIYYGCSRIDDYFPPESMIQVDIADPRAVERIQDALADEPWKKRLDAIAEARKLVLQRYQLFPFLVREIEADRARGYGTSSPANLMLTNRTSPRDALANRVAWWRHGRLGPWWRGRVERR